MVTKNQITTFKGNDMDPMIGMIFLLPFSWAPNGYSVCQGQTVQLHQYAALYSLIGNTYGGDAANSNFMLPDLRGRVPLGAGVSPTLGTFPFASSLGETAHTLTQAQMPAHSHQASFAPVLTEQNVTIPDVPSTLNVAVDVDVYGAVGDANLPSSTNNMLSGVASTNNRMYASPKTADLVKLSNVNTKVTGDAGSPGATVKINALTGGAVTIAAAGKGESVSLMQPYLAMNFVIAMVGIYPDRP
ncbi:tail fiber protein [Agrobacterium vaccinii]|nr:tail fiber protein [Agrobacterium vaccinii]